MPINGLAKASHLNAVREPWPHAGRKRSTRIADKNRGEPRFECFGLFVSCSFHAVRCVLRAELEIASLLIVLCHRTSLKKNSRWLFRSKSPYSGRLRLNLNPLNLVRWIDSWPFDKTWKLGWIDSTWVSRFNGRAMNLEWIFIMTPSCGRKSFSKASPYFFCTDRAGLRRGQIQCRSIISHDFRRFSRTRFTR